MANIDSVRLPNGNEYGIAGGSNQNLLINPWFTVNQRGQATYSASAGVKYTVDRWKFDFDSTSSTLQVSSSGVTLNNPGAYVVLRQKFEDVSALVNRTITASIKLSDGTIYSGSGVYDGTSDLKIYFDSNSISLQINHANGEFRVASTKSTLNVRAVKLEIGSVSTLHLDTAPDYTTELLKCQRYFYRLTNCEVVGISPIGDSTNATAMLPFPVEMRAVPSFSYSGSYYIYAAKTVYNISVMNYSTTTSTKNAAFIGLVSSGMTGGQTGYLDASNTSNYLDFSAEL